MIWIVDADAKQVEVWTPDARFPAVETEGSVGDRTWAPSHWW